MIVMGIVISEDILLSARMSESELLEEIAVLLFQKEKLTLGQAGRLAGMPIMRFQLLLAARNIPIHYDVSEFMEDLETLKSAPRR